MPDPLPDEVETAWYSPHTSLPQQEYDHSAWLTGVRVGLVMTS
jgi:hypothetical protein